MIKNQKLKFGIICESTTLASWQVDTINELIKSGVAKLDLIILAENYNQKQDYKPKILKIILKLFSKNIFYSIWQSMLEKDKPKNIQKSKEFINVTTLKCNIKKKGKYRDYFGENDLSIIKKNDLDFILRFGLNIITGEILEIPKYGIWSFHHGDERKYRGRPACFWEMYDNEGRIGGILQRLTEKLDGGVILKRWFIKNNKKSWKGNLDELRNYGTLLPKQVCIDIINREADYVFSKPSKTQAQIRYVPTNIEMIFFIFVILKNYVFFFTQKFMIDSWKLGLIEKNIEDYIFDNSETNIKWIGSKDKSKFFADPFICTINEKLCVFFEKFDHNKNVGSIAKFFIDENKKILEEEEIIKDGNHYSFPYIFEKEERLYLIPEQMSKNKVEIYEMDKTSGKIISKNSILNDIQLSDPIIFYHNSKFWLLGTIDGIKLMAWHADNIHDSWKEHGNNPIKIDISSSRNAGRIFYKDGDLIRLSQDCSKEYGSRIAVNKISELSKNTFKEEALKHIEPHNDWLYNEGLHTVGFTENFVIIDAKKSIFHLPTVLKKSAKKLGFKWI